MGVMMCDVFTGGVWCFDFRCSVMFSRSGVRTSCGVYKPPRQKEKGEMEKCNDRKPKAEEGRYKRNGRQEIQSFKFATMEKTITSLTRPSRKHLSKFSTPWISHRRNIHSLASASRFSSGFTGQATLEKPYLSSPVPSHCSLNHIRQTGFSSKGIRRSLASSMANDEEVQSARTIEINGNGKMISLSHDDLIVNGLFHAAWLWTNDPVYCHPSSGQRLRSLGDYDVNSDTMVSAEIAVVSKDDEFDFPPSPPGSLHPRGGIYKSFHQNHDEQKERLKIVWKSGETSYYDLNWLARFNSKPESITSSTCRVTKDIAIGAVHDDTAGVCIPRFDYGDIMNDDGGSNTTLLNVMGKLMEHGAVLIQNAPAISAATSDEFLQEEPIEATVANLGRRICNGRLSHGSLYGDVFHVQSIPGAHNIAYTSEALPPHQDLTYYESKPFLQLLHCVQNAKLDEADDSFGRGESILIDAMAAADELRRLAPDLFETLCLVEATFCKQREGADMISAKPHIVVSSYDQSVIEINWSPPFEGPLLLPPTADPEEQERLMEDYVIAYQAMNCLLDSHATPGGVLPPKLEHDLKDYAQRYTWEYALKEGEILVFNNQRMLHGRRSFSLQNDSKKHRHLIGCYTDVMDTLNHFHLLLRENSISGVEVSKVDYTVGASYAGFAVRNPGNGTRAVLVE